MKRMNLGKNECDYRMRELSARLTIITQDDNADFYSVNLLNYSLTYGIMGHSGLIVNFCRIKLLFLQALY